MRFRCRPAAGTYTSYPRAARKELEDYKSQVVAWSEKIDALKERHKLLPHLDQDFTVPMTGETLAAYSAVAEQLDVHRRE